METQKWKYLIVRITEIEKYNMNRNYDLEKTLNEYGKSGWELCWCEGEIYIFKRLIN